MRRREAQGRCPELAVFDEDPGAGRAVVRAGRRSGRGAGGRRGGGQARGGRGAGAWPRRLLRRGGAGGRAPGRPSRDPHGGGVPGRRRRRAVHRDSSPHTAGGWSRRERVRFSLPRLTSASCTGPRRAQGRPRRTRGPVAQPGPAHPGRVRRAAGTRCGVPVRRRCGACAPAGTRSPGAAAVRAPPTTRPVRRRDARPADRPGGHGRVRRAKTLAERLYSGLAAHGLACTRLGIHAHTDNGEELVRVWRCAEPLTPGGIADRVRWQLNGWLRGPDRPTAGVHLLRLNRWRCRGTRTPAGAVAWRGPRRGRRACWSSAGPGAGLLGPEGAWSPVLGGGRDPGERVRLVPWGDERCPRRPGRAVAGPAPAPSPSRALSGQEAVALEPGAREQGHRAGAAGPAVVLDSSGNGVEITARYQISAKPCQVVGRRWPARAGDGVGGPVAGRRALVGSDAAGWTCPDAGRARS